MEHRTRTARAGCSCAVGLWSMLFGCSPSPTAEADAGASALPADASLDDASAGMVDASPESARPDSHAPMGTVDATVDATDAPTGVGFPLHVPTCDELTARDPPVFSPPPSDRLGFDDVSDAVGFPAIYGMTASWGDVNDDGWPDVFVPRYASSAAGFGPDGFASEILLNCGGAFHRISVRLPDSGYSEYAYTSAVVDVDRDGRQDLVLGDRSWLTILLAGRAGAEQRLLSDETSLLIVDLDVDGDLDLYVPRFTGANPLLLGAGDGSFVEVTADYPEIVETSARETYAASLLAASADGADDLLYIGNHGAPDALLAVHRPLGFTIIANDLSSFATMGVDHFTTDDGDRVLITASDTRKQWLYELASGVVQDVSDRLPIARAFNTWGVRFEDFDNDGFMDLAIAHGDYHFDPTIDNRLLLLRGLSSTGEEWAAAESEAGPLFDGTTAGNYYSLATADFDLDGCVDMLITSQVTAGPTFAQPIKLLRNRCGYSGHWIGFTMADDPGAHVVATIRGPDGGITTRRFEVRAASGVASRSMNHQVHIGLGDADEIVNVHVRCRDGRQIDIEGSELPIDTHHLRPDICAVQ
jgi:hypothetical protein